MIFSFNPDLSEADPPSSHTHATAAYSEGKWIGPVECEFLLKTEYEFCQKVCKKSTNLLCVKAVQGLGSVDADLSPDPESKSGPMAWIRTPFFLYL